MKNSITLSNNNKKWTTLLIAIIIIISDDTLLFGTNRNSVFEIIKYSVLIAVLFILGLNIFIRSGFRRLSRIGFVCIVLCTLVLLSGTINGDLRTGYFYKCIIFILSCEIVTVIGLEEFARKFEKIMFVLALASVICTLIAEVNLSVFSAFPAFFNSANSKFYNLGICMIPVSDALRNYGMFREPGVYQMFLMLALLFHIYHSEKMKISHLVVLILSVILTFSTTGYIALAVFLILFFVKNNVSFRESWKKYFMVFLFVLGIIYLTIYTDLLSSDGMIFDKFSNMKRTTTIARFASIFSNIEIWKTSPVFGAGLIAVDEIFPNITYQLYGKAVTHNTNTLFCELATYGIVYTGILVYGYVKFSRAMSSKVIERILVLLIICILAFGEKLTFSPIVYILLFYGFSLKGKSV